MSEELLNKNVILEGLKIIITALTTSFLTYSLTLKKEVRRKKYRSRKKLFEKVYVPIIKIINNGFCAGDEYEGLDRNQINLIIDVIETNIHLIEPKLESFYWQFKEELLYESYMENEYGFRYDTDKKFLNYVEYQYNKLRKKLYLEYSSSYFLFSRIKSKFNILKYK